MTQDDLVDVVETFGPYRLRALLGRGGMGEVWLAQHSVLDREVALKRIAGAPSQDPELRARFRREARLAARLSSAHVVPIHEFGEIDGRLFLDMRYVRGPDLRAVLDDHPYGLPPAAACDVVAQVADALDSAHEQGLVHRDVKPSNVLVDQSRGRWFCYLADFGVAVPAAVVDTRITTTGATIGTPAYMAPELLAGGDDRPGVPSDVYALGCLLYELLTGRTPYPGANHAAVFYQHVHAEPPRPSAHRPELAAFDHVVATALAKDPARRYRTAGDLARALPQVERYTQPPTQYSPYPQQYPPPPRPPGTGSGTGGGARPPWYRRPLAIVLALVVLAGVAVGGYFGVRAIGDSRSTVAAPAPAPAPIPTAVTAEKMPLAAGDAYGVAVSHDGRTAYVVTADGNTTLAVFDTATRQVTRRIAVDVQAYGVVLSPDETHAYVSVPGNSKYPADKIQIVDLVVGRVTSTVKVGARASYPAISADGSRVYVTVDAVGQTPGALVALDTTRGVVAGSAPLGPDPAQVALSPDGRTAYVPEYGTSQQRGNTVSVIDTATMQVTRTITVRPDPTGAVVTPDGRTLYVATNAGGNGATVDMIDTTTFARTELSPPGLSSTGGYAITPDGQRLLIPSPGGDDSPAKTVSVLDPTGQPVGPLASLDSRPSAVAPTPDGHHAYATTYSPGGLWLISFP